MHLQIDLFSDVSVTKEANRLCNQITTRKFTFTQDRYLLDAICSHPNGLNGLSAMVKHMLDAGKKKELIGMFNRHYIRLDGMGDISYDNMYPYECLGLADNGKRYIAIVDMSFALDYVLHSMLGCDMSAIHSIEGYQGISYALLNLKFKEVSEQSLSVLVGLDPKLDQYFMKYLLNDKEEDNKVKGVKMIQKLCTDVISHTINIRSYVTVALSNYIGKSDDKKLVLRSRSLAGSVMGTNCNHGVADITLTRKGLEPYTIQMETYKPLEYTGRCIDDIAW